MKKKFTLYLILFCLISIFSKAQISEARRWNEVQLEAIREDLARPPVQARNLFHVSLAMYDAWAAYDVTASTYLLGKTIQGTLYPFSGYPPLLNNDTLASQKMALSFAVYRVLRNRYSISPNSSQSFFRFDTLMQNLGYDKNISSTDYINGGPAEFGNYLAEKIIQMGIVDGAHQTLNYSNYHYLPINNYLYPDSVGTNVLNINRWQPLSITNSVDQNNNPIASNQVALCHEWGEVVPFSLQPNEGQYRIRNGEFYKVYLDPGIPSKLDTLLGVDSSSLHFKWANEMVAIWSTFHTPNDSVIWDISPKGLGNLATYPLSQTDQFSYYNFFDGGDYGTGHAINPATNLPYSSQNVLRGDYTRVVSQYWADGPNSETPPGHWFVVFNKINDHPLLEKKYEGQGQILSNFEWDIKGYFTLGGAMHDAAIAAWSLKGWYDSPRPITTIRKMAQFGQSSDSTLPHYHPAGLQLIPGYIELISASDSLALGHPEHINKIKIKSWLGFSNITNPLNDVAGVGWILGEKWIPYQRKGFVTPPFAGYVSGHSTYSRAGAEVLKRITNNSYFPGGIYETLIPANSNFLQFEKGPSTDITLQWATFEDASNEASLSRIYGGIHPPTDDAPGRNIGVHIGNASVQLAKNYFSSAVLPVKLNYFTGNSEACKINLQWVSNSEEWNNYFEIWRSQNGKDFDEKIAQIPSKGNGNEKKYYEITDFNPLENNIYQLSQTDIDGKKTILSQLQIKNKNCNEENAIISLYPNPANDFINITFHSTTKYEFLNIKIIDVLGKTILEKNIEPINANEPVSLSVDKLIAGNYMIMITNSEGIVFHKKFNKL